MARTDRLALFMVTMMCAELSFALDTPSQEPQRVSPGKLFEGSYINITAPKTEGWYLIESSSAGMSFARGGNAPNESFAAGITMFPMPTTNSPEEFEAFVVQGASQDAETARFSTKELTHQYSEARGYPCVKIHNVSEDREAEVGAGKTAVLLLENEHLYCRHPVRTDTGFAISFSHRGSKLYPTFFSEAQSFIEGVQVPAEEPTLAP